MLDEKLESLRGEMNGQLRSLQQDVKELGKSVHDIIRFDGQLKATDGAIRRIGEEVRDHEKRLRDHEKKLSDLEKTGTVSNATLSTRVGAFERLGWILVTAAVSTLIAIFT